MTPAFPVSKEKQMISSRTLLSSVLCAALFSSLSIAQDLSKYRDFQFGTNIESVASQIQMKAADARTMQQRPALIQTLQWTNWKRVPGNSPGRQSWTRTDAPHKESARTINKPRFLL